MIIANAQMKKMVERVLNLFPEVKWDRWTGDIHWNQEVGVYGWIDKGDGRSDFVLVRIDHLRAWMLVTSSAKYSADFAKRLGFAHSECKKVKGSFRIKS